MNDQRQRVIVTGPQLDGSGTGGVKQHVLNLLEAFRENPRVECRYFEMTTDVAREPLWTKTVRGRNRVRSLAREAQPSDVVHINASLDTKSILRDVWAARSVLSREARVILQFHGGRAGLLPWGLRRGPGRRHVAEVAGRCDRVLFLSEVQRRGFEEAYGGRNHELIGNYVDVDSFSPGRKESPTSLLFMGRLEPEKGVRETLGAFRACGCEGSRLVIAGSGSLEDWVASECTATEHATFAGYVTGKQKQALLEAADVVLLPTAHPEGLPYVLLEGAAAGCALVATRIGGIDAILVDGSTGISLPDMGQEHIAKAIDRLCADEPELRDMQREARALAARDFSFTAMEHRFEQLYLAHPAADSEGG